MPRIIYSLFCFFIVTGSSARFFPGEGSQLHYRIIGFSFDPESKTDQYQLDIASGDYHSVTEFNKHIIITQSSAKNRIITEVPYFGNQYTWRVTYKSKNRVVKTSSLLHFTAVMNNRVDTFDFRLHLAKADRKYQDYYVLVDGIGVIYDMNGRPVWYLPEGSDWGSHSLDLKFTDNESFTFRNKALAWEIDYAGKVLWTAPKFEHGQTIDGMYGYHDELTPLKNGHFMEVGEEHVWCKTISNADTTYTLASESPAEGYTMGRFATIMEYDEQDNLVWKWRSWQYLVGSDFDYYNPDNVGQKYDAHDIAFFLDENKQEIYLGFKTFNKLLKISYPDGKVLGNYGINFKPGAKQTGTDLFCNMQSIGRTEDGSLYYYNNNTRQYPDSLPSVIILKEPRSARDSFSKIWDFNCKAVDDSSRFYSPPGNVKSLPDSAMFIFVARQKSNLLIATPEHKIVFQAYPESFDENEQKWRPYLVHHADIISKKDLEKMIWKSEK